MKTSTPALLPMLASGAHRRPEDGACFMEFASVLAGERFSDHPACTHPVLAAVARTVNDLSTDDGRQRLVPLIPAVIGTADADPILVGELIVTCYRAALALASCDGHRRFVAGNLRKAERRLDAVRRRRSRPQEHTLPRIARPYLSYRWTKRRDAADIALVLTAVAGASPHTDEQLADVLRQCIDRYQQLAQRPTSDQRPAPDALSLADSSRC